MLHVPPAKVTVMDTRTGVGAGVGGTGVAVGGAGVGATGVAVGGTDVGGTEVALGPQATTSKVSRVTLKQSFFSWPFMIPPSLAVSS